MIESIIHKTSFTREDLVALLSATEEESKLIFRKAEEVKNEFVGNKVYFRGLIEFSNICGKNCYYCGIRAGNEKVSRYNLSDKEILEAARFAYENHYASVVLQSGEIATDAFSSRIAHLVNEIKTLSEGKLGITLSLGEQDEAIYREWFNAGAHRYLLRIETSNRSLYKKIHPQNQHHNFNTRLQCLVNLRNIGYQVGTGVMIGLPFQSIEDLADDLLFLKEFDVDMVGMGPYIEHPETPMYEYRNLLKSKQDRLFLALKMIAVLRILMKDINIAAATALQAIDSMGREKGIKVGANIIMPNITPGVYRNSYALYEDKPCTDENPDDCTQCLEARISMTGNAIGYNEWGDSKHFKNKKP
ncbi:MAG TPA: [FeFe] hydrogenase H-cluster radical SAM maturase HydE [Bacteroidales bacterium]|nr:[FeFe] hydrogenase H-cluster radical SAM maturase HydE [Bacteroidales bacterium]